LRAQATVRARGVAVSPPQADVLDRSRKHLGPVLLAVGRDLCGISLKALVVEDVATIAHGKYKWVRHLYRRIKDAEDTPFYPVCTFAVPRSDRRASLQSSDETRSFAEA
jgi:hypothetical protein